MALKSAKLFTLIGKPTRQLDTPSKTNGTAQFGLDVSVPRMLTAVVARPPVFGGKTTKFDASETLKVPGVKVVQQVPSGVAVIGERFWPAKIGRDKLVVDWDLGPNGSLSTEQMLRDFERWRKILEPSPGRPVILKPLSKPRREQLPLSTTFHI